jgi:Ca2+-transporting ATPase
MKTWHTQSSSEIFQVLSSSEDGLNTAEAGTRLETHGPNELQERKGKSALVMMGEQFSETMVLILIAAAIISAFLGKATETAAILAIVVLFAVLGFVQEYRAERAMAALKQLAVPVVRVRREGTAHEISARDLVPGDMVLLEAGNAVPADVRLVESASLRIQEAALTGESEAVEKHIDPIPEPDLPLGDRRNMAYLGTAVTYGRGSALVVATGMSTELGKIASLIQEVAPEQTPLQKRLDQVGKTLAIAGVVAGLLVLLTGVLFGEPLAAMFLTAVSVAVAVVPEGLPAVVTITLALGAQKMLRRNALIRRLPAVETLGSVTVICSDKTGTLTENRMTVSVMDAAGERLNITETMRRHQPSITEAECQLVQLEGIARPLSLLLAAGALCNDAVLKPDARAGCFHALGDPTEGALLIAAAQAGMLKDALEAALPRTAEVPFDSERKRMTTVHRVADRNSLPEPLHVLWDLNHVAFTKGAVDSLLDVTTGVWTDERAEPLTPEWRARIQAANDDLAKGGMRVLGVACRFLDSLPKDPSQDLEKDLTFIGLVGLMDPPRAAVRPAVETCKRAGIRPVMITGDHPLTALAIARDLQMADSPEAVTGEALNRMEEGDLGATVDRVSVYARVSSEDKLRIVTALQRRGQVVAMTGDGVNDSPALKKADIGVAMGITGTDVAKEAADMVLLDDNFATIVAAVEEGRVIYDNLLRFIKFSLGGNLGKVLVMLCAPLLGINAALSPLQLLWLNLLTDGLMGLGLGVEPAEADAMSRPPRRPGSPVLDRPVRIQIAWVGGLIAILALGVGAVYFDPDKPLDTTWQTMIFMTLGFTQIGNALGLRASGSSPLSPLSNPLMTVLTLMTIGLQLAVIYLPFMKSFFGLTPLTLQDLGISFGLGVVIFVMVRIEKVWLQRS